MLEPVAMGSTCRPTGRVELVADSKPHSLLLSMCLVVGMLWASLHSPALAQTLPPIYAQARVELARATTLSELPKGTFLENIAADRTGTLFVNSHLDGTVYRIDPAGRRSEWAKVDGTIAGIALNPDGSALVSGWIKGVDPAVFTIDPKGKSALLMRLPGAQFPNGVVRLSEGRYLIADSYRGVIWDVDSGKKAASVWLEHESLTRADASNPTPGANGVKVFGGALYVSNTVRRLLIRVPIVNGTAGSPQTLMKDIGLDDFDFDDDGVLYGTTHVYNSVVRVAPNGDLSVIAGLMQGMAGSTAAVVVKARDGKAKLFVVTNGGLSLPPEGGLQTAKLLQVELPTRPAAR
jgi:hypothetical protein